MSGFFLGGAAEGMADAEKQRLARETLATEAGLRQRGLGIQERGATVQERAQSLAEKNAVRAEGQQGLERVDKQIADTMATVAETVKHSLAAGRDPATIQKAVAPLVDSVKRLAPFAKRDPATFDAQVSALLTNPNLVESATAAGTAAGTSEAAKGKALAAGGIDPQAIKDPKDLISAEGALRDDYFKQSGEFIKIRDAKNRLDKIEETGAGDIALLFQFMKILDPGSTVREGEFATAGSVAGVPGQIEAWRKKVVGGGRLADDARKQILSQSEKLFQAAGAQQDKLTTKFADIAKRQKLRVDNVVVDIGQAETKAPGLNIPAPPPGFVLSK